MVTPRYKIGDKVFFPETHQGPENIECPDCKGTRKWTLRTPAGWETETDCLRCDGKGVIRFFTYLPFVKALTIGQIRTVDPVPSQGEAVEYMCKETGIGSGSIYRESRLFPTETAARMVADYEAAQARIKSESRDPDRVKRKILYHYQLKDAELMEMKEEVLEIKYKYRDLMDRVCELENSSVAAGLMDSQLHEIQKEILKDPDQAQYLSDYRRA